MTYNLLFDTKFQETPSQWKFTNCSLQKGYLVSNHSIFGISQEIVLPQVNKLYLRFNYNILKSQVKKIKCGIQYNDELFVSEKSTKLQSNQTISIVENHIGEKITIHLIFESDKNINVVKVFEPLLCDLGTLGKSTWIKSILDKTLKYKDGLCYRNLLSYSQITPEIFNLEKAKIGSIVSTETPTTYKIEADLVNGKKYLLKLDYRSINNLGKTSLAYGILKSKSLTNQEFLLFKADGVNKLEIDLTPDDILPYQVNLRNLLLVDIEKLNISLDDIPYLPYTQ